MRFIDADDLLEDIRRKKRGGYPANKNLSLYAESCVLHAPTIDPVKHGKWTFDHMTGEYAHYAKCSVCGKMRWWESVITHFSYCPDCGAKMDLEEYP